MFEDDNKYRVVYWDWCGEVELAHHG